MSAALDEQAALTALAQQDLDAACPRNPRTGRSGLTADRPLRVLILRQLTGWTYAELAFHLADSAAALGARFTPGRTAARRSVEAKHAVQRLTECSAPPPPLESP